MKLEIGVDFPKRYTIKLLLVCFISNLRLQHSTHYSRLKVVKSEGHPEEKGTTEKRTVSILSLVTIYHLLIWSVSASFRTNYNYSDGTVLKMTSFCLIRRLNERCRFNKL